MKRNYESVETATNNTPPRADRRTQLRKKADEVLREIAFVLKMTQQVRTEIEGAQEARELAFA
jgi:hypothetical protein